MWIRSLPRFATGGGPLQAVTVLLVFAALLSGCELKQSQDDGVRYVSLARTSTYEVANGTARSYLNEPYAGAQAAAGGFVEILGNPVRDCSDKAHVCLGAGHTVFAVPIDGMLTPGMMYQAGGVEFRVIECWLQLEEGCKAALIVGDCQVLVDTEGCRPARNEADREFGGSLTYFVYNADIGVTAFGNAGRFPEKGADLAAAGAAVASQLVLQSEVGLLKEPINASR